MRKQHYLLLLLAVLVLVGCSAAYGDYFVNDPYVVASSSLSWWSDAAYNPVRNEYCMTWQNAYVINWRRLDSTGANIGSVYVLSDGVTLGHRYSVACYNSARAEYLILYSGWLGDSTDQVRVLRVDAATGNQIGSTIYLDSVGMNSTTGGLDIAYSSTSNSYLAVYESYGEGNIYARLLDSYGNPISGRIQIDTPSQLYCRNPQVAWNSANNEFMVTYMGLVADPSFDYFAQRVRASDGALLGSNLQVTTSHDVYNFGGVAYDSSANRYLVVYDGGASPPYGQLVSNTATLVGSAFAIGGGVTTGWAAAVCYDSSKHEFLVSWAAGQTGAGHSRRVSQSGVCIGDAVNNTGAWEYQGLGNWPPRPVYNSVNDEFLIHWHNSYAYILDRRFKTSAAPISPVTNFVATAGNGQNVLTWTNPGTPWTGTLIKFSTSGYPTLSTGTQIYNSNGSSYTHTGLTNGVTYYYTAFAHDAVPNYATGVNASATPSATPGLTIIPKPQELTWKAGTGFLVNGSTQIMANSSPDVKEQNMAQQLQRKVWDMTGYLPSIVYGGSATSNVIAVGDPARCPAVSSIIATWSEATGKTPRTEGYMLGVKDTSIVIRGFDNAGSFYGSQTLIQLLEYFKTTTISPVFSYDYPDMPLRGGMWKFISNHDWAFTKELTSEMLARYKLNAAFVRVDNGMQWDSHPELPKNDPSNPVTKGMYIDYFNFADLHYMVKMPSSAGAYHNTNEWLSSGTLYSSYREDTSEPETDSTESFCPLHTGAQGLVRDLWNEVLTATNTPFFGAGHSEYHSLRWSGCPRCTAYPTNAAVYNQFIWNDYDWCNARGKEQIIFGDMLRDQAPWGGSPGKWNTAPAVSTIPDATIIEDWEYGSPGAVPTDYPTIDRWLTNGLNVIGMPYGFGSYAPYGQYYGDKENIYYWATALQARKGSYPTKIRGLIAFNKYTCKNRDMIVNNAFEQQLLGCFPYYAAWGWNVGDPYWNPYPYGNGWSMVLRQLAPATVTGFAATRGGSNNNLAWTNPTDSSFTAAYIVYRTDRFPTSPIDGTYVADVAGSPGATGSYSHVGGPSAAYYAAFAHDNVRHFSPAATSQVGVAVACFQDVFAYSDGALNGNGGWTGTAGSSHIAVNGGYVRILGGGDGNLDAIKTVTCNADASGYITVSCKINGETGAETMWNLWIDDSAAANFARWYGSATTARGRIGTTGTVTANQTLTGGWQTLKVKIHPTNNTTEFFLDDVSLGVYDHGVTGVGNTVGRLRFERINNANAAGQSLYFDDLTIGDIAPPADTTPPGAVSNFVATAGDTQANLSWTNPTDADYTGTMVRFSTAGYPGSPTGGSQVYNGTGTSTAHTGLANGVTYYYTAWAYDEVPNYSSSVTASAVPADTVRPGNVTSFMATPGNGQNSLSWTNPGDADFAGTKIMFKTTGYPTGPADGTQAYSGTGTSTTHTGLTNGVTYYYSAWAFDEVPNYSAAAAPASATPSGGDTTPPANVTNFTATAGDTQNSLSWTNPGDADFAGTMIRFSTVGYPGSPTGGSLLYQGAGTSTTHTGLTNGVTYYYAAFAYDEVPNYSGAVTANAVPVSGFCFQDEFTYPEGVALVGQGGWTGTATNAHIQCISSFVQVFGGSQAKNATKTMNCGVNANGIIWVRLLAYRGGGADTSWNVWINDSGGKNFARWYGSGTTARGRIGTSGTVTVVKNLSVGVWDSLVVAINPAANTTQFYFNGEDLGVYSHGTQPGSAVGQVKIERENNSAAAGQHVYLDNIRVGGT